MFVVPLKVGRQLEKWGIPPEKITELGWHDNYAFAGNLTITATPSQHFSGRTPFDSNRSLWASWVITTENHNVFFSGDSGYFDGFRAIGKQYGPFDVTFLECGAYNEAWSMVHMSPEETAQAFIDLKGEVLHPIHWATFNLALHSWYEPVERLLNESIKRNIRLSVPIMGSVVTYDEPPPLQMWWLEARQLCTEPAAYHTPSPVTLIPAKSAGHSS
jgi:L-ascorbate metabolism protein UlaG (beta-lactamase superfamily)